MINQSPRFWNAKSDEIVQRPITVSFTWKFSLCPLFYRNNPYYDSKTEKDNYLILISSIDKIVYGIDNSRLIMQLFWNCRLNQKELKLL